MSIVQAVSNKIIEELKNFHRMDEPQKMDTFKTAYFIYGRPFLQALTQLQTNPSQIQVQNQQKFTIVQIKKKKQILFYKNTRKCLQVQCTCETAWLRNVGEKICLVCKHQAIYLLSKYCFVVSSNLEPRPQLEGVQALIQMLQKVKE